MTRALCDLPPALVASQRARQHLARAAYWVRERELRSLMAAKGWQWSNRIGAFVPAVPR